MSEFNIGEQAVRVLVGFIAIMAVVVLLLAIDGPVEPCREFTGWRWESAFPKPPHCR